MSENGGGSLLEDSKPRLCSKLPRALCERSDRACGTYDSALNRNAFSYRAFFNDSEIDQSIIHQEENNGNF